ncbi:MAG: glycoside hydrolase family 18 [Bacteroides sp.]|nr:glycoside hydrolase family 18 [Bacteroides sp.]MCM1413859.1 glycoside hydrolase family 18 [Bacteroides sp.]MCM1471032.1 glycoside hydrolase family 18 [Bacteroides sp.]
MKGLKAIIFAAAALITVPAVITSCDDWTEPKAEDFYQPQTPGYKNNLKDYFASPHKVMFGWFGSWTGTAKANSLVGLPDSTDFVSLWLQWGPLTDAQQQDLKAFQDRGSRAVLCWLATNIGENITPGYSGVPPIEAAQEYWGFTNGDVPSMIEAAKKYADAIADTCDKYNIDGFDMDIEATGTLIYASDNSVMNEFLRQLRKRFDEKGRMLVLDIPGGTGWLGYYDRLDNDVLESVDYICWQTYELGHSGLDNFFNAVKNRAGKGEIFENVMKKSIVTATFERASDKDLFPVQSTWKYSGGIEHAGQGAYHIEYDYPGNPDYPYVRKGITTQNPPINN